GVGVSPKGGGRGAVGGGRALGSRRSGDRRGTRCARATRSERRPNGRWTSPAPVGPGRRYPRRSEATAAHSCQVNSLANRALIARVVAPSTVYTDVRSWLSMRPE